MIILVTGGTGFIGSNLCKDLVKDVNNHVICLDNNFTGNLNNIKELFKVANIENGEKISKKCAACHDLQISKKMKIGPPLWNIIDRESGSLKGFKYSKIPKP